MVLIDCLLRQVRDGNLPTSPEIGTYCGNNIPPAISSSSEYLWLNFISDFSVASNGFRLEYITNGRFVVVVGFCCCFFLFFFYSFGLFLGFKSIKAYVKAQITLRKIIIKECFYLR